MIPEFHESPVGAPPNPPTAAVLSKPLGETAQQRNDAECPREKLPDSSEELTAEVPTKELRRSHAIAEHATKFGTPEHGILRYDKHEYGALTNVVTTIDKRGTPEGFMDVSVEQEIPTVGIKLHYTDRTRPLKAELPKAAGLNAKLHKKLSTPEFIDKNCETIPDSLDLTVAQRTTLQRVLRKVIERGKERLRYREEMELVKFCREHHIEILYHREGTK